MSSEEGREQRGREGAMERWSEQRGREGAARKGGISEEGREQWSEGVSSEEEGAARKGGSNGARE